MDLKRCDKNSQNSVFWRLPTNVCFCKWFPQKKHVSWIDIISMYILEKKLKRFSKMCMCKTMATGKIRWVAQLAKKVKISTVTLVVQTAVISFCNRMNKIDAAISLYWLPYTGRSSDMNFLSKKTLINWFIEAFQGVLRVPLMKLSCPTGTTLSSSQKSSQHII